MSNHAPHLLKREYLPDPLLPQFPAGVCVSLIGMAGAGKSTVGAALAKKMEWALMDTDHLIEAHYGVILQTITDALSKEEFLDLEATVISGLRPSRSVLATGGSVIYRDDAMRHLASLGPVIYLDVPLAIIQERIARNPNRGLAIAPGQTIEELYNEREALYRRYADMSLKTEGLTPEQCASVIVDELKTMKPRA